MKKKLKSLLQKLLGFIPVRQPIGRTEFDLFANRVFSVYSLPDLPSYRSALSAMILQEKSFTKSIRSYAIAIRKAQANETAYQIMQEIRQQEKVQKPAPALTGANDASVQQDPKVQDPS